MSASPLAAFADVVGFLPLLMVAAATFVLMLWLLARPLAEGLIRLRVRPLPAPLAERYAEEWSAEAHAIDRRLGKVTFALALFLAPTRTFVDAVGGPDAVVGNLIVRSDVRVHSTFGRRLIAVIIDDVITLGLGIGLAWSLDLWPTTSMEPPTPVQVLTAYVLPTLVHFVMHVLLVVRFGGSPGKLAMGLRIVPMAEGPLTFTHAALRVAPVYLFFLWALTGIGFLPWVDQHVAALWWMSVLPVVRALWSLADLCTYYVSHEGRALHDHLAGTVVVLKGPDIVTAADVMPAPRRGLLG